MNILKMNNGLTIPQIGYGVYLIPADITERCVLDALSVGYRHIDTAYYYRNETEVGSAIRKSGIPRGEIFVTTKIVQAKNYDEAVKMIEDALRKLDIEYIDLMLIHWPEGDTLAMWRAMEDYVEKGLIKSIGLSNFYGAELDKIMANCRIKPVLNQIETHVYNNQKEEQKHLDELGIILESWSPLAAAHKNIFADPVLLKIAEKHGKTVAQVVLRYLYERNIIIIPKTINIERMKENLDILDFKLDQDDIIEIESLNTNHSIFDDDED